MNNNFYKQVAAQQEMRIKAREEKVDMATKSLLLIRQKENSLLTYLMNLKRH